MAAVRGSDAAPAACFSFATAARSSASALGSAPAAGFSVARIPAIQSTKSRTARPSTWFDPTRGIPPLAIRVLPVHLGSVHAQRRGRLRAEHRGLLLDPGIVAEDALDPRVNAIVERPLTPRRDGIGHGDRPTRSLRVGQDGVRLVVGP